MTTTLISGAGIIHYRHLLAVETNKTGFVQY